MLAVTADQVSDKLRDLPPEKLAVVYDFVSYLAQKEAENKLLRPSEAWQTMLAAEPVLRRDWERPEEDEAWVDL